MMAICRWLVLLRTAKIRKYYIQSLKKCTFFPLFYTETAFWPSKTDPLFNFNFTNT